MSGQSDQWLNDNQANQRYSDWACGANAVDDDTDDQAAQCWTQAKGEQERTHISSLQVLLKQWCNIGIDEVNTQIPQQRGNQSEQHA
jgi:hypothetical protein